MKIKGYFQLEIIRVLPITVGGAGLCRPPQQLEKHGKLSILSIKTWLDYKNGVFDAKTAHHCPMSGQDPGSYMS